MMLTILRRHTSLSTVRFNPRALTCYWAFQSFASKSVNDDPMLSPFFTQDQSPLSSSEIKVVDSHTWELSSGLANLSNSFSYRDHKTSSQIEEFNDEEEVKGELDLDEIEDMRIHGSLFYKIDRGSKEFEEYSFDFHRRKPRSNKEISSNSNRKEDNLVANDERVSAIIKEKYIVCGSQDKEVLKKQRKPTYNQLTGPYHEPFCLDIYVSKESVRACVVHRVTSKVVTVAHSISKDMKFDLGSTRNAAACVAVGKVLAQRSLADDIHDVIFTPRKGDKLEGKLQIVLQSLIDNGVNVKVKLKQRNVKKSVVQHFT